MVAIRGSHLVDLNDFVIEKWCLELNLPKDVATSLIKEWYYASQKLSSTHIKCNINSLLAAGVEMVEILHSLNMDGESLQTAMLYPLVNLNIVSIEDIKQEFGINIAKLLKGVSEMDNI